MLRKYIFQFLGTKNEFLNRLNRFPHNTSDSGDTFYYLNDYIVKRIGDEIHFGIARGSHCGGYWFVPIIVELEDNIELHGKIQYIDMNNHRNSFKKFMDDIGDCLLFVVVLPIILVVRMYMFIEWIVRKIFNHPKPKEKTDKERLFDLMENYLECVGK